MRKMSWNMRGAVHSDSISASPAAVTSIYTYEPLYERTQVTQATNTTESYSYDPVGNRLSSLGVSPYSVNSSNELASTPSSTYTYDNNGNTLTKVASVGTTTFGWDYENRLTSVTLPGTGGSLAFKYDGLGHRVQKVFTQGSNTTTTNYLYDGNNAVADIDQNGNVLARYAATLKIDEPLAMLRSSTMSYYSQDGLGSITSLTTSAGALGNTYRYDSFGNLTSSSGSIANRFQYTAREFDIETGLYFYRARYYDQTVGKFINEDPSGTSGGSNLYEYALNNVVNLYDPTGLQGTKPNPLKVSPNAVFYICCQGGNVAVCDNGSGGQSGWVLDCMRAHEQQHIKDFTCGGANPCQGKPNGPLGVTPGEKSKVECAAYKAELQCLLPAPMTKEIGNRRNFIQKQIKNYCGGG
jgi:RHS repeat-associated protein